MSERWTVLKLLRWTAEYFSGRGIDTPRLDAELLLADTLGLNRVGLYVNFERPVQADELASFRERVKRRAKREPLAYILGSTEFWSLPFIVTPAVLIPRPETELLVEETLVRLKGNCHLLDVGTGSGAVAITLAKECPELTITAIDLSSQALEVASDNAQRHGVAERIHFARHDLAVLPAGPFDFIVANPPYIPSGELPGLMPEVRDFEPQVALDGGIDGLNAYRAIVRQAESLLTPDGWLLLEVGCGQASLVQELLAGSGLVERFAAKDLAGIERVVGGQRAAAAIGSAE